MTLNTQAGSALCSQSRSSEQERYLQ